ncbi:MAG: PqqD family protein [Actinobacteria bacterium]|nr:PqqD family protein [Actinomycetota bacterium]
MRAADIDTTFVPRRSAAAWTEELDGECVILDEAGNRLHHLNATATVAWTCFDGTGTLAEIAADLAEEFDADAATAAADLLTLARDLGAAGLLDGVAPDPDDEDASPDVRGPSPPADPE